jgi:hypothetical protein
MRIASDGRPYEVDNISREAGEDEAEVIQYLKPDGRRRRMLAPVGDDHARLAKRLGMILSAESLGDGESVVLYGRLPTDDPGHEIMRLAVNGPGAYDPSEVLKRMISALAG